MPQRNSEAKDEMNLAEFPLCALAHRLKPEVKTLRFEDRVLDKGRNEWITRQLTVTGSDAYGLPTELDDEVLLGLIQLTRLHGFADRKVPFTRHELIRMLGWRDDSKSYARVEASLNRWTGVTLFYNKAWWNKERKCWMDEKFHILDNVWLCHRGEPAPDTGLPGTGAPLSAFVWNEVVFRSFTHGNLKSIDFEFFKSLKSAVAKRLYRFLDKRFWHCSRRDFDLRELCCEHIGLSRNYDTANLKRKLLPGIRELEERGFLRPRPMTERFTKVRRGHWGVAFESAPAAALRHRPRSDNEPDSLTQSLIERGVTPSAAARTVESFPVDRIKRQVKVFDWLVRGKDAKVSRNPAGFLVASIKGEYGPPNGYSAQKLPAPTEMRTDKLERPTKRIAQIETLRCAAQDAARRERIDRFWHSRTEEERLGLEVQALAQGGVVKQSIISRGGAFADATKMALLDAFALKVMQSLG